MRTPTRVEKYRKLREEISRMPEVADDIDDQSGNSRINITRFEKPNEETSKGPHSTIEFGLEEIMASVNATEEDSNKLSPIQQQKRKEVIRIIILLSILLVLLIGVVILGIYAFN